MTKDFLKNDRISRLALGTVQFGIPYGVANTQGQVNQQEVEKILGYAYDAGVNTLDTAIAYGESEKVLGNVGVETWRVISKLPAIPRQIDNILNWVMQSVYDSLERLKVSRLYGLLLHHPEQLLESKGGELYQALSLAKEKGLVEKIGISIYSPTELEKLYPYLKFDLIQSPFNIIDSRLVNSGWLSRLKEDGVEVHVRSIFLQGLLLMDSCTRPKYFSRWQSIWDEWDRWLDNTNTSRLECCLGSVISNSQIDRIVVGVDSLAQLQEILDASERSIVQTPNNVSCQDQELLNPSLWGTD